MATSIESRLVDILSKAKLMEEARRDKVDKKVRQRLAEMSEMLLFRFGYVIMSHTKMRVAGVTVEKDSRLVRDLLTALTIICETRQVLLDSVDIYLRLGHKPVQIFKEDLEWLFTTLKSLETVVDECHLRRAQHNSRAEPPSASPLMCIPMMLLRDRTAQMSNEEREEFYRTFPQLKGLPRQVEKFCSASDGLHYDPTLILLLIVDEFGKAVVTSVQAKTPTFAMQTAQLFSAGRMACWASLLEVYQLDLSQVSAKGDEGKEVYQLSVAPADIRAWAVGLPTSLEVKDMTNGALFSGFFPQDGDVMKRDVFLFFSAKGGFGAHGSLYYCAPDTRLETEECEIPVDFITSILVGKETPTLQSFSATSAGEDECFTIFLQGDAEINLQASSPEVRTVWLRGINRLMSAGNKRVYLTDKGEVLQIAGPPPKAPFVEPVSSSVSSASSSPATASAASSSSVSVSSRSSTSTVSESKPASQWQECRTNEGKVYYYDKISGKTQWEAPPGFQPPSPTNTAPVAYQNRLDIM